MTLRLLGWLRRAGLPFAVPEPVPALDGGTVAETPAGPAKLCHWLPGMRPDLAGEPALERFGRTMGVLGEALREVPPGDAPQDWRGPWRMHPSVPDIGDLGQELRAAGVSPDQVTLLETTAARVEGWRSRAASELPVQVVHGDLGSSNLLADERTGQVAAVLDFEIAGADLRVQDGRRGTTRANRSGLAAGVPHPADDVGTPSDVLLRKPLSGHAECDDE